MTESPFEPPRAEPSAEPQAQEARFEPPRRGVLPLLILCGALDGLVSLALVLNQSAAVQNLQFFSLVVSLLTVVAWGRWVMRAARNIRALYPGRPFEFTPGWSFGWYFVPFANLVVPFHATREPWRASCADDDPYSFDGALNAWWGFWLASNILANMTTLANAVAAAHVRDLAGIIAAALALLVVTTINKHQLLRAAAPVEN